MEKIEEFQKALERTNQFLDSVHARLELSNENENKIIELLEKIAGKG